MILAEQWWFWAAFLTLWAASIFIPLRFARKDRARREHEYEEGLAAFGAFLDRGFSGQGAEPDSGGEDAINHDTVREQTGDGA